MIQFIAFLVLVSFVAFLGLVAGHVADDFMHDQPEAERRYGRPTNWVKALVALAFPSIVVLGLVDIIRRKTTVEDVQATIRDAKRVLSA